MANPYHDGEGRFCSKGEMQAAVQELGEKGNLEGYFKLRSEYEAIESGKLQISNELISKIATSGINIFDNRVVAPDDIREIYKTLSPTIDSKKEGSFYSIVSLVNNPATPDDIREDILKRASPEIKYAIAEKGVEDRNDMLGADLQKLVKDENDEALIGLIMRTRKLTFEDRYKISKQSNEGLALLAASSPDPFFSTPELEKELRDKATSLKAENNEASEDYFKVMARYSRSETSHEFILDNASANSEHFYSMDALHQLASNKHLSPQSGLKLAKRYVDENIVSWQETVQRLAQNNKGVAGNVFVRAYNATARANKTSIKEPVPKELKAEYKRVSDLRAVGKERELTTAELNDITTVEAHYNSYEENFKGLLQRHKQLKKRNAPEVNEEGENLKILARKYQYASAAIHGKTYVTQLDAMITDPRNQ